MKNLKKKSFKQYVLFSFGELILIIAGILIAMNINNWNENRISLNKANSYIAKIKKDLEIDTTYFNSAIKRIDLKIDYKKSLFNADSLAKFSTSNIQSLVTSGTNNISINDGTYKKMVESGIVTLPEKEFLFEKLNNYYSVFNNYLNEFNSWEAKSVDKDMDFWIYQNHYELEYIDATSSVTNKEENRKNLLNVVSSKEGKNYINMAILREERMKEIYTKARDGAKKLIRRIDSIQN
ncbi:hypothetical protein [uncultured Kordia sp.]|uniref:hypothetical protein n=1 Tax=uncultured Kordia sp. TaxID=507699 RepID=UPI002605A85F|nr:hypothetical protein [uncultured Kordia sp.]